MKRTTIFAIILILGFIIEIWWNNSFKILGIVPNLVLCILVYIFNTENTNFSTLVCIISGIIEAYLILSFTPIISYFLIIPSEKYLKKFIQNNIVFYILNILIASFIYEISMWIFTLNKNQNFSHNLLHMTTQILYNIFVGFIIYFIFDFFNLGYKKFEL